MMFIDRIFTFVTSVTKPRPDQKIPLPKYLLMMFDDVYRSDFHICHIRNKTPPRSKDTSPQVSTIRVTPLVAIYAYNDKKDRNKPIPSYRLTRRSTPCVSHNSKHSSSRS
nr:MAG TPA: hypothetical protein [Caudoviricetes sp.]